MDNSTIPTDGEELFSKILAQAVSNLEKPKTSFIDESSNKILDMSPILESETFCVCESDSEGALKNIPPPEVPRTHILVRCWKKDCPADFHYQKNALYMAWIEAQDLDWGN